MGDLGIILAVHVPVELELGSVFGWVVLGHVIS